QYGLGKSRPDWIAGEIYMPYPQAVLGRRQFPSSMTLVIRTATDRLPVANEVRNAVLSLDPDVPLGEVRAMGAVVSTSLSAPSSTAWLFGTFAALALVLGAMGIYSLISYSVAERTHEIGVRLALGAQPRDVLKLVVRQGMAMTLISIAFGL